MGILRWLGELVLGPILNTGLDAWKAKLQSDNEHERIEAERFFARVNAQRDLAVAETGYFWSATRIGRMLFVLPLGVWWAAGVFDSVFLFSWNIAALPPQLWAIAEVIIPSLFLAESAQLAIRYWGRR